MSAQTTRVARASRGVQRRIFLKAAALGLAAPAALNLSRLAVAQQTGAPKRLLIFHMPHGVPHVHYNPQVAEGDWGNFALDQSHISVLGPLEPYKQLVNVYQGFKYPEGGGPHVDAVNFLTDSASVEDTSSRLSIDHAIAKQLGVKPLTLGACAQPNGEANIYSKVFWDGLSFVLPEKNPVKAADRAFSMLQPTTPQVNPDVAARQAILDLTISELQGLRQELASLTAEQTKLQAHLDAVTALRDGPGGGGGVIGCSTVPALPHVEEIRALAQPDEVPQGMPNWYLGDGYEGNNANFPLILRAQMELATQAIACNVSQIVTLQAMFSTSQMNFGFAQIPKAHHLLISHVGPESNLALPAMPDVIDFAKAQRWFVEQLAEFVIQPMMADDPSAPGTRIIDNTIIYFCSEIGDGQFHNLKSEDFPSYHPDGQAYVRQYLPLVTIGGGGGALKTQRIVRNEVDRPAADLYLTLAQAMGAPLTSFGESTGVISEVLA